MFRRLITGVLLCGACATAGEPTGSRPSQDIITRADLDRNPVTTAYEIIQRLRPQWLRLRGSQSITGDTDLVVYVDNARMGGTESLRGISLAGVEFLRRFDPAAATLRWGAGHASGAILISTIAEVE
jgi:hypothetical protein